MKLGCIRNYHKGQAAIRHYANLCEPLDNIRFKLLLLSWQWERVTEYCNDASHHFIHCCWGRGHVRCEHQTLLPSPHTSLSCPENPDTCFIMNTTTTITFLTVNFSSLSLLLNNSYLNSPFSPPSGSRRRRQRGTRPSATSASRTPSRVSGDT